MVFLLFENFWEFTHCPSVYICLKPNSSSTDKPILMELYTVAVYNLRWCIKDHYPSQKIYFWTGRQFKAISVHTNSLVINIRLLSIQDNSLVINIQLLSIQDNSLVINIQLLSIQDNSLVINIRLLSIQDNSLVINIQLLSIQDMDVVFALLAAILHLCNIEMAVEPESDEVIVMNEEEIDYGRSNIY